jgi:type IV pilus assembly protein PilV
VYRNESGFTLIEFLVAIVIMMVGLLGLLQAVNVGLNYNMSSQIRNEATIIADEELAKELAKPFDLVSTTTAKKYISNRPVLNGFRNFSVVRNDPPVPVMSNSKQVNIIVSWKHKSVRSVHETSSIVSKRSL